MVILHFKMSSAGWKNTCEAQRHHVSCWKAEVVPLNTGKKTTLASSVAVIINVMPFLSHVLTCQEKKMTSWVTLVVWDPSLRDCKQEEVRKNSAHYFKNSLKTCGLNLGLE